MKAISTKSSLGKRKKIIIFIIIILALMGIGAYIYFNNKHEEIDRRGEVSAVTEDQARPDADNPSSQLPPKNNESQVQQPPANQNHGNLSALPEKPSIERAGGDPTIRVVATFQKASSGHCELQFNKPGQKTVSHTSPVIVSTSYYTCSFSVPRSSLPDNGPWNIIVVHHAGGVATPSDTKELE